MPRTPQVGQTSSTQGMVITRPLTIAALNAARANAMPQNFGDSAKFLPPYIVGPTAQNAHPNKDGGL